METYSYGLPDSLDLVFPRGTKGTENGKLFNSIVLNFQDFVFL